MLSGKAQAATRPTAMGSLLQAATYGQTIPTVYGVTQSPLLAIWAANLRQGGSVKKFKQLKKGITAYVENIDFLLGHNPIMGVLQMWNNGAKYPLNFVKYTTSLAGSITPMIGGVADQYALACIAVTVNGSYSVTFNDYGGAGSQTLTGDYEIPMWNELQTGPDPTHNSGIRNWPYCYRWAQGTPYTGDPAGITIYIDSAVDFFASTVNIYYAQLTSATSFYSPLVKNRLAFEPELGSGTEYSDADLSDQQIVYPMFAGAGSSDIDLGSGGVIPELQAEVQGKFSLYSQGDGDFADMIEDVFKSGVAQAALGTTGSVAYSGVEHGLSSYQYPGCVQIKGEASAEEYTAASTYYNLQVTKGNFLVVIGQTTGIGGSDVGISDTADNTWTAVFADNTYQVWYAQANATAQVGVIITGLGYDWRVCLFEVAGVDTFDQATVSDTASVSITTTNQQGFSEYLLAIGVYGAGVETPLTPANWTILSTPNYYGNSPLLQGAVYERIVIAPGTYSITMQDSDAGKPLQLCILGFKCANPPSYPKPVGDFIDLPSLDQVRLQCRANGLWGSLSMNSQQEASDWLKTLYQAADAAPVFCGFTLFSMPYSEVSAVGNGAIYSSPTAAGPVYSLSTENGDFVANTGDAPITVKTAARVNQPNVLQMQCINRSSDYNPSVVEQPDAASISFFGVRKADPIVNNAVQDVSIARQLLGIQVRKLQYGGDVYSFRLQPKWCLLAPMGAGGGGNNDAVITITDPLADINQIPVRLTSVAEQSDGSLECTAEPFVYGMYAPTVFSTDTPSPYAPDPSDSAGNVNTPIFLEPTPALCGLTNQAQLWIVVSSPAENYGGCQVYISVDGGTSYVLLGAIAGNAATGVSTADWPAATSPDTTNDLALDLTESLGVLDTYSVSDEDNFVYPCYIAGGGSYSIPYELMTYAVATLTAANKYTLKATGTGNHLDRGVFGAPAQGTGVDHPTGSRWALLSPDGSGILKVPMNLSWVGTELYFKFLSVNNFGAAPQSLSDVSAYTYTPNGASGSGVQLFLVNGA